MPGDSAKYVIELTDKASKAAADAERAVSGVQRALAGLDRATSVANLAFAGWANAVVAAAARAGRAVLGYGHASIAAVLDVATFRESSLSALTTVMDGAEAAGRAYRNAIQIANQTPLDTRPLIEQTVRLSTAGFGEREIAPLTAAMADVGAAFGNQSAESLGLVLGQIRAAGRLTGQDLMQLSNAGVNRLEVLQSVARQLNLTGPNEAAIRRAAQQAISSGRVSGDQAIQAALDAIRARLDRGGPLGTFARRQADTLGGALSNLRNAAFNLLAGIDLANSPGIVAFRRVILSLTEQLGPQAPLGQRILGFIDEVSGRIAAVFQNLDLGAFVSGLGRAVDAFAGLVRGAIDFAQAFGPAFADALGPTLVIFRAMSSDGDGAGSAMRSLGAALGYVLGFLVNGVAILVGGLAMVLSGYHALFDLLTSGHLAEDVLRVWMDIGAAIRDGFVNGIRGAVESVRGAVTELGQSAIGGIRDVLGIHSPSRVMRELGRQTGEGFALGLGDGRGRVGTMLDALVAPSDLQLGEGSGRKGPLGAGGPISITVHVDARGATDPAAVGEATRGGVTEALAELFDRFRLQGAPA